MRAVVSIALCAGVLALSGCASAPARTPGTYVSQSEPVFLISEAQADQILVDAMNVEFGASPIVRIEHPNKGYQATIKFFTDSHQIVATMVREAGRLMETWQTATTSTSATAAPCRYQGSPAQSG